MERRERDFFKPPPHQWVMIPHTVYEITRELRVRESRHTVMLWPKRYYNSDLDKFEIDKIETIASFDWRDHIATEYSEYANNIPGLYTAMKYSPLKYDWDF